MTTLSRQQIWLMMLCCGIFILHSAYISHVQDDAYISYRYVENLIDGYGLVFNYGEQVEGYTNFLWIIILTIAASAGLSIVVTSQALGVSSGVGALVLSTLLTNRLVSREHWYLTLIPPLFLSLNGSLAYWSVSGLETSLFVFLTSLALYVEMNKPRLTIAVLVAATLTRPEGALLFGTILLYRWLFRRDEGRALIVYCILYAVSLLPYIVFKIVYYGDILPNPFYAKTGLSLEYLRNGIEYVLLFAYHYGLFGLFFLLPLPFARSLPGQMKLLWVHVTALTIYIVFIGGDVLKAHRFFLPIIPLLYVFISFFVNRIMLRVKQIPVTAIAVALPVAAFSIWTVCVPWSYIETTRNSERALVENMVRKAEFLKSIDPSSFSIATTTIGKIAYQLRGHRVIDMLGLTDPETAKKPEVIEGLATTWKERNFNIAHLLSMKPDYILFSTGYKPSAPAERALFLNSHFRQNYSTLPLLTEEHGDITAVWKRTGTFSGRNSVLKSAEYANSFHDVFNLMADGDYEEAEARLRKAIEIGKDDFSLAEQLLGTMLLRKSKYDSAFAHYRRALAIDPQNIECRMNLYAFYRARGDTSRQSEVRQEIYQLAPWLDLGK